MSVTLRYLENGIPKRRALIDYSDTGENETMLVYSFLNLFFEASTDELQFAGQDHKFFLDHGVVFVITRIAGKIYRLPKRGEELTISTWQNKLTDKFYEKECTIKTDTGEMLGVMRGGWVLLDAKDHKIITHDRYPGYKNKVYPNMNVDSPECKKIIAPEHMKLIGKRPVYFSDLDLNHHVSSYIYARIAEDFLPNEYRRKCIKEVYINYDKETRSDEIFEIIGGQTDYGYVIIGNCDGIRHFAVEYIFSD